MRRLLALALCFFAGSAGITSPAASAGDPTAAESTAEGKHVVVRAAGTHEGLAKIAEQSRDVIEAAVPTLEKRIGAPLPTDVKLDVRVFVAPDDMKAALAAEGVTAPEGIFAITERENFVSYVLVEPTADPEFLKRIGGLPSFFRVNLVHECVHQWIAKTRGGGTIIWPPWYAEGMANAFAYEALAAQEKKGTPPPVCADAIVDLANHVLEAEDAPGLEALFEPMPDRFTRRSLYAVATDFYTWLMADAEGYAKWTKALEARAAALTQETPTRKGVEGAARAIAEALVEAYGPLPEVKRSWSLATRRPAWRRIDGSGERVGDTYVVATVTEWPVRQFAGERPSAAGFSLTFDLDLGPGDETSAAVFLGRQDAAEGETGMRLSLARTGTVTLEPAIGGARRGDLDREAALDAKALPTGRFVPVRVDVRPRRVELTVGGARVATWDLAKELDATAGLWGFGANRGIASFRALKASPLPAK